MNPFHRLSEIFLQFAARICNGPKHAVSVQWFLLLPLFYKKLTYSHNLHDVD